MSATVAHSFFEIDQKNMNFGVVRAGEKKSRSLVLSNLSPAGDTGEARPLKPGFHPCSLADMERRHILATLKHTGWNKSRTAGILGIDRPGQRWEP